MIDSLCDIHEDSDDGYCPYCRLEQVETRHAAAEAALQGCGILGLRGALPEAIEQMAHFIKEQSKQLTAAEQRAERLAVAGRAFVEAWEKCHQLEKTDVAYRLMVDALADNKSSAESSNRCPHCNAADTEYGPHHVKECPNWTPF